ncbi:hypothetical protein Y032_0134g1852 [Ancylostoma ceylanicum]|uniref:Endonuclease/exonuclease/phosphatase domain-containing protein n=1 Tax=Ancylostoma ceylanicum TaxID=53326 RepID=A0A016T573_9BILA|nr:hypothetical protein Y032_0134g1852 [Ancylostoma ceylanicum]
MFEKPAKRRWTWESLNGLTRSEIDHILTNRRWSLFDVSVLPSFDTGSEHRLIRAKITLNKKNCKRDTHRPAPHKIPTFKSADLESAIESNTWTLFEDPTEDYDHLVRGLLKCADASRLSQPTTTPRLNAHATALLEKRKAVKLDPNATHLEKVITGKACRVAVKESLRDYGRMKLLEAAETKSSIKRCKRDLNDQRNVMAALKDKEGKMQSSRRAMENIVQQFYTELFRSSTLVPRCPLPPPEDLLPILESEVGQAIKKGTAESMKKGTAPAPDNIPADLLRAGSTALHSVLTRHFNHYLRKGMIPDQWKESKTILLFKKRSAGRYCQLSPNQSTLGCIQDIHQDPPQPHGQNSGRLPTSRASWFSQELLLHGQHSGSHPAYRKEPRISLSPSPSLRGRLTQWRPTPF